MAESKRRHSGGNVLVPKKRPHLEPETIDLNVALLSKRPDLPFTIKVNVTKDKSVQDVQQNVYAKIRLDLGYKYTYKCIDLKREDFTTEFAVNDSKALDSWVVRAIDCQTLIPFRDLLATVVDVWPEQLDPSHIHLLIVGKDKDNSPSLVNGLSSSFANLPSLAGPPSLTDPPSLVNPPLPSPSFIHYANGQIFLRRVALLEAISKLLMSLEEPRIVQLRGTPGTGKSVLLEQLCDYLTSNPVPSNLNLPIMTVFIHEWPSLKSHPTFEDRFERYVRKGKPDGAFLSYQEFTALCKTHTVVVLHDEAQLSFDEQQLWSAYDSHPNCYVIAAYSYGVPSESDARRRPPPWALIPSKARILMTSNPDLPEQVRLCYTRTEFDQLQQAKTSISKKFKFHRDFMEFVYAYTGGHPSAADAIYCRIGTHLNDNKDGVKCYLNDADYAGFTLVDFDKLTAASFFSGANLGYDDTTLGLPTNRAINRPNLRGFFQHSDFSRGLPDFTYPNRWVSTPEAQKFLVRLENETRIAFDAVAGMPKEVKDCFLNGYINLEGSPTSASIVVAFASPLHQYMFMEMFGLVDLVVPQDTVLDFVCSVIQKFICSNLVTPYESSTLEDRYTKEFYRAIGELANGKSQAIATPEYSAPIAHRPGRIDFYIWSKHWGIEFARERDSNLVKSHCDNSFIPEGTCNHLNLKQYILLDFRTSKPSEQMKKYSHLNYLYYVIFSEDFSNVTIQNSKLEDVWSHKFPALPPSFTC